MGDGSAWGGRLPCKQDIQMGSIPISSTKIHIMCSISLVVKRDLAKVQSRVRLSYIAP